MVDQGNEIMKVDSNLWDKLEKQSTCFSTHREISPIKVEYWLHTDISYETPNVGRPLSYSAYPILINALRNIKLHFRVMRGGNYLITDKTIDFSDIFKEEIEAVINPINEEAYKICKNCSAYGKGWVIYNVNDEKRRISCSFDSHLEDSCGNALEERKRIVDEVVDRAGGLQHEVDDLLTKFVKEGRFDTINKTGKAQRTTTSISALSLKNLLDASESGEFYI